MRLDTSEGIKQYLIECQGQSKCTLMVLAVVGSGGGGLVVIVNKPTWWRVLFVFECRKSTRVGGVGNGLAKSGSM